MAARRRLSRQQQRRIHKSRDNIDLDDPLNHPGRVISHRGGLVEVETTADQATVQCTLRSNLGDIVAGDRVVVREDESGQPAIIALQARDNLLRRQDGFGQAKSVAANITQLIVCLAVEPEPNLFLLDQYLLSAEQQNIDAVILLNKVDLLSAQDDPFRLQAIYSPMGYRMLHTSIKGDLGMDNLRAICARQVNVISGVSGVGKSSLTKALLPDIEIRIGEISQASGEGRHTTRTSRLYHLPCGGDLIDTPGVRGFNPVIDDQQDLAEGFRDLRSIAQHCRFANCRHFNEPGCAVASAIVQGSLPVSRYEHYRKMLDAKQA
jgi:ribosome biogenesis GTPase